MRETLFGLLFALACGTAVGAQELVHVESRVVSVSADSVYLDLGREAGILSDDRVVLHPQGAPTIDAVIRDVTKSTSRAEIAPGSATVAVGTRAEVLVPKERLQKKPPPAPSGGETPAAGTPSAPAPPPPHPKWTHPPEEWTQDTPLLAPLLAPSGMTVPGEPQTNLPRIFSGRVYLQSNSTWDKEKGDQRYASDSVGTEIHLENPFGRAGAFDLQTDVFRQRFTLSGEAEDADTTVAVRRLSYSDGGTPETPTRWEVGRFLQHEFPELGTVDGVDWSRATSSGNRFGVNAGGFPAPFLDMRGDADTEASLYYRWFKDSTQRFSLGAAYQNSWHEGKQDRNLFLGTVDYATGKTFSTHSAVWIDYYDSTDTIKSQGFELTELQTQGSWNFHREGGVGFSASHRRIPELLRDEFSTASTDFVKDGRYDRAGINGWKALGTRGRAFANADLWQDQDDSGERGEIGLAWRDLLYKGGEVGASVFTVDGSFSSGDGFRVSANKAFARAFGTLAYEFTNYDQKGFAGTQSTLAHHAVTGTIDFDLGRRWNLSLLGDKRFGDEQDSYSLGFLLQVRF
jgi:hypothetical protein